MAAGISGHRASVLPRSLAKMRKRRRNLSRLKSVVLYLFILVAIVLGVGIFRQQARLEHLMLANREAEETLSEMEAAAELLDRHDALGARIEPIIRGQLKTRDSLESFRRIQRVHEDFDFTLIRFVDGRTYFHGMDERAESDKATEATEAGAGARSSPREGADEGSRTFVVELTIPGGQAERLQVLGDIVGRLREEQYFANVDRLLDRPGVASAVELSGKDRSYALLLTLTGERPVAQGEKKGAGL